jgi:hypothetical protein
MLRRTSALLALLILAGSVASAQQPPQKKTGSSKSGHPKSLESKGAGGATLDVTLDLNKIVDEVAGTITANRNREAWVKALLERTASRTGGKYNVMVFNMQQNYDFNPPAGTFKFAQATFKGGLTGNITYGVWVFTSAATFTNRGDGGYINWAFYGSFQRNGGAVAFSAAPGRNPAPHAEGKKSTKSHK